MARYAALLRAVNVTGVNRVPMKALAELIVSLGHGDVVTYIQSGNVALTSVLDGASLRTQLRDAINQEFALTIDLTVFDATELAAVAASSPYVVDGAPMDSTYVGFLGELPTAEAIARLDPDRSPPDEFTVIDRAVHLLYRNGAGKTKLTSAYFERALSTMMTVRNWNTIQRMVALTGDA